MKNLQLSEHFRLAEMTQSDTAIRLGIDNSPPENLLPNLAALAATLEQIRILVGLPVRVSSGYRSQKLNKVIGGSKNSAHLLGLAADISVDGIPPKLLAERIRDSSGIGYDQLIYEGTWVHVGLSSGEMRGQVLTAVFNAGRVKYIGGIA